MKKSWAFIGLGIVLATIVTFLLRLITGSFFQSNVSMALVIGGLGVVTLVIGMIKKMNKTMMFIGSGILITALVTFLLRLIGLNDNVTLLIIMEIVGLAMLIYGLVKGK